MTSFSSLLTPGRRGRKSAAAQLLVLLCVLIGCAAPATAAVTSVTPITWNIVGLDSNTPAFGPNRFPVGARVCADAAGAPSGTATFYWEATSANPYINLRDGGAQKSLDYPALAANACFDAYYEIIVTQNSLAYDTTRSFYIEAGGKSTPRPRELYVERLVSQGRNAITNLEYKEASASTWTSVSAGGAFNLVKDGVYDIRLSCYTATQGYEQLESFSTLPFTIFEIQSVSTFFNADTAPTFDSPLDKLYLDACLWDSDPNSPNYRACSGSGKAGGTITVTYRVKIIEIGTGQEALMSVIHDFSGSSFHYNSDYLSGARTMNLIDPTTLTIGKGFSPTTVGPGGSSTLTFTLTNPNTGGLGSLNFVDSFPADLVVATPLNTSNSCGGILQDSSGGALTAGDLGIKLINGYIPAGGSCTITVDVTASVAKTYSNTSGNLFVGAVNTGKYATADLTVQTGFYTPPSPPAACSNPVVLATWTMPTSGQGSGAPPPLYTTINTPSVSTATANFTAGAGGGGQSISTAYGSAAVNSWAGTGWATNILSPAPTLTSTATPPYFDITVDTSNYGGARITFNAGMYPNGDWNNPANNRIYVYSGANSATPTWLSTTNGNGGGWVNNITANAATTGNSTTTFRIAGTGSTWFKGAPTGFLLLDDITVRGCPRPSPPTITKTFNTNPVAAGETTSLTFTITNPNENTVDYNFTNIAFTDVFPSGMTLASTTVTNGCGGSVTDSDGNSLDIGDLGIKLTGAAIPVLSGGSSCQVVVSVKVPTATEPKAYTNTSGNVSATVGGTTATNYTPSGKATATLYSVVPPTIEKNFSPASIIAGGVARLTFLVSNPNPANALNSVAFSDTFPNTPGAMQVAATSPNGATVTTNGTANVTGTNTHFLSEYSAGDRIRINGTYYTIASITNDTALVLVGPTFPGAGSNQAITASMSSGCGAATFNPVATNTSVSFSGGSLPAGGLCTVRVDVTAPTAGTYNNTVNAPSHIINATTVTGTDTAFDFLSVIAANPRIALSKEITDTSVPPIPWSNFVPVATGGNVWFRFSVENTGNVPLTLVRVTDPASYIAANNCNWVDGDGIGITRYQSPPVTGPYYIDLPTANASNNKHIAYCILGPTAATAGNNTNTATAEGQYSSTTYTDVDTARFATVSLQLNKQMLNNKDYFTPPPGSVTYTFKVKNTGFAPLAQPITITDPLVGNQTCLTTGEGDLDAYLDPGEELTTTCTATYAVTATDINNKQIVNTATASAEGFSSNSSTKTIFLSPELAATKVNDVGGTASDASFIWTINVTNSAGAGLATFNANQLLLQDDLPASGASYTLGTPGKVGVGGTGSILCVIDTDTKTLTCKANGGTVTMAASLTGTVAVTNGSPNVSGTGTNFDPEINVGDVLVLDGKAYTVATRTSDIALTLTENYFGTNNPSLSIPGSFTIPITVNIASIGSLVNPRGGGGICQADPEDLFPETNTTNNNCSNSVVIGQPLVTILKSADKSATGAKPGEEILYTLQLENTGNGLGKTVVLRDDVSPYTQLKLDYDDAGPLTTAFSFSDTTPAPGTSGLSIVKTEYSTDNGASWIDWSVTPPPDPDADGYNGDITNWRLTLTGPTDKFKLGGKAQLTYKMKVE